MGMIMNPCELLPIPEIFCWLKGSMETTIPWFNFYSESCEWGYEFMDVA